MARIAGVNIPTNKRVVVGLQYIHGIGPAKAKEIMEKVSIPEARRVSQLTDQEVLQLREVIDRDYVVEGDLRREVAMNIKRLMDLGCYRGLRHRRGLPVRGQRTHPQGSGQAYRRQEEIASDRDDVTVTGAAGLLSERVQEWVRKPRASAVANARTSPPALRM